MFLCTSWAPRRSCKWLPNHHWRPIRKRRWAWLYGYWPKLRHRIWWHLWSERILEDRQTSGFSGLSLEYGQGDANLLSAFSILRPAKSSLILSLDHGVAFFSVLDNRITEFKWTDTDRKLWTPGPGQLTNASCWRSWHQHALQRS